MTIETPPEWAAFADLRDRFKRVVDPYATAETMFELHGIEVNAASIHLVERTWSQDKNARYPLRDKDGRHLRWAWRSVLQLHKLITVKEAALQWAMSEDNMVRLVRGVRWVGARPLAMSTLESQWGDHYLDDRVLDDLENELLDPVLMSRNCCVDVHMVTLHHQIEKVYGFKVDPVFDEVILARGERAFGSTRDVVTGKAMSTRRENVWLDYRDRPVTAPYDACAIPTVRDLGGEALPYLAGYHYNIQERTDDVSHADDCGLYDPKLTPEENWAKYFAK